MPRYNDNFKIFIIKSIEREYNDFKDSMMMQDRTFLYFNHKKIGLFEDCYNYLNDSSFWTDRMLSLIEREYFSDVDNINDINFAAEENIEIIDKIWKMVNLTETNCLSRVNELFIKTFISEDESVYDFI